MRNGCKLYCIVWLLLSRYIPQNIEDPFKFWCKKIGVSYLQVAGQCWSRYFFEWESKIWNKRIYRPDHSSPQTKLTNWKKKSIGASSLLYGLQSWYVWNNNLRKMIFSGVSEITSPCDAIYRLFLKPALHLIVRLRSWYSWSLEEQICNISECYIVYKCVDIFTWYVFIYTKYRNVRTISLPGL